MTNKHEEIFTECFVIENFIHSDNPDIDHTPKTGIVQTSFGLFVPCRVLPDSLR